MMDESVFFAEQLRTMTSYLLWAAAQVPEERRYLRPPFHNAEWPAARELFHLALYERSLALPSMRLWLGGPPVDETDFTREDELWADKGQQTAYGALLQQLSDGREEQIKLLPALAGLWDESRDTGWTIEGLAPITLRWVVMKTLQHATEHASAVSRISLFWDAAERHSQQAALPDNGAS
jgi:hypothetical protein